jgi:lipoteichoic acid synthase
LYYSDFLQSADSKSALSANFSVNYLSNILLITLSAFLFCIALSYFFHLINEKLGRKKRLAVLPLLAVPVYFFIAPSRLDQYNFKKEKLANPVAAFIGSVNPFASRPPLFTMNVPDSLFSEFQNREKRKLQVIPGKIKNVLMVVLESTPAEYVSGYTSRYTITPNLEKYLAHSALFENVYAHAPATNNSMVSLLASVYPWLSYNSITREHPDIQVPTLSSELKKLGYRTGFFNSADNRFQKAGEFLFNRRMDCINDCRNIQCGSFFEVSDEERNFLNGKDDECTADELLHWIDNGDKKPFFGMMWTYQTHYPYFFSGKQKLYSLEDSVFNRYLNAVEHNDFVLGKILRALEEKKLSASTLVIVVGDHGEAFGRHNQTTHASNIYEENVHVPCVFIHPAFNGERIKNCGGIIDIAPTVMNLLGHASPEEWQGSDLFANDENKRVYFFTPWGDYQFGYRQQNLKYIFNATENTTAVYDLISDPEETVDLSGKFSEEANRSHLHMAAWVQWHSAYLASVLKRKEKRHF